MDCISCRCPIVRRKPRVKIFTKLNSVIKDLEVVRKVFPHIRIVTPEAVICNKCYTKLREQTIPNGKGTKRRELPIDSTTSTQPPTKKLRQSGAVKDRLRDYFNAGKYQSFVRLGFAQCPGLQREMVAEVCRQLHYEMLTCPPSLKKDVSTASIAEHRWHTTLAEVADGNPILSNVLDVLLPNPQKIKSKIRSTTEIESSLRRKKGTICAIAFHAHNPSHNRLVQAGFGVAMWRQGVADEVIKSLQQIGLSQCPSTIRAHADVFSLCHANELTSWTHDIKNGTPLKEQTKGFSLCWDNVEIETMAKNQGVNTNQHLSWGMTFCAQNRVNTNALPDEPKMDASNLPSSAFAISIDEMVTIRDSMTSMVEVILKTHMPCLKEVTLQPEKHPHYDKMCEQSNIISLGVVSANPSSTPGTITIMSHMAGFVPESQDITCGGDGLSMQRMEYAHRGRENAQAEGGGKLSHLQPTPQEFHKEILLLQDTWNNLFTPTSKTSVGSLYHLKQAYRHRSLKANVMANFNHSWNMLRFSTHGYVVLHAMDIENMPTLDATPNTLPDTSDGKRHWLRSLSSQIVDTIWAGPKHEDLVALEAILYLPEKELVADATLKQMHIYKYCCGKAKRGGMVQCSSFTCKKQWLHYTCAGIEEAPQGDFFCSQKCQSSGDWIGCYCHRQKSGERIECSQRDDCCGVQFYHKSCTRLDVVPDPWYCREDCRSQVKDGVYTYSKSLMWTGLSQLTNHQALRDGDGPMLALFWKWQLIHFFENKHPNYFVIAHNFLASIGGFVSPRMQADMLWNRTANLQGRTQGNIGLDMVNEFLNKDFKEMLKKSKGQHHQATVDRAARLGGAFGKKLDGLMADAELISPLRDARHQSSSKYDKEVCDFTKEFQRSNLFTKIDGRSHRGLEGVQHRKNLRKIPALAKKILQCSQKMDKMRRAKEILNF